MWKFFWIGFLMGGVLWAQIKNLEEAIGHFERGNYENANSFFIKVKNQNSYEWPFARYYFGLSYFPEKNNKSEPPLHNRKIVDGFFREAYEGFLKLRKLNSQDYRVNIHLADLYHYGWGTKVNLIEASKLYFLAVQGGSQRAAQNLNETIYRVGILDAPTLEIKKIINLQKLAQKKHFKSIEYLVDKYLHGDLSIGLNKDYDKALEYLNQLTIEVYPSLYYKKGIVHANRRERDYTQAYEWFKKGVEIGDANSIYSVGLFYEMGLGVEQNYIKARQWYLQASKKKHPSAYYKLGLFFLNGYGVLKDHSLALKWLSGALKLGHAPAICVLSRFYAEGEAMEIDLKKSKKLAKLGFKVGKSEEEKEMCRQIYNTHKLHLY